MHLEWNLLNDAWTHPDDDDDGDDDDGDDDDDDDDDYDGDGDGDDGGDDEEERFMNIFVFWKLPNCSEAGGREKNMTFTDVKQESNKKQKNDFKT